MPMYLLAAPAATLHSLIGPVLFSKNVSLFASIGEGTLMPWDPARKSVVRRVYRYVLNPMKSGLLAILLGQAWLFAAPGLCYCIAIFVQLKSIYDPFSKEPRLEYRFGENF